ncbi:DUF302 domain-containing protein [Flavobacterium sp. UBA6031]|uniref:DUF302 domain-containing protein n=1 Tax=Flavobacterium sp. UBA6031 TaxID=1946551 RepID=UPI0025C02E8C|nr:DUF302 domain-containing protein [Flavobacterium sp. UBA6031]
MNYYMNKTVSADFEQTVQKVIDALKTEGFGVLSEINIDEKLKEKLGVNFRKYKILGACNPAYAYKALQLEDKIGVMLPCNVIIQETKDGSVEVSAVNPISSMSGVNNPQLMDIAGEIQSKLRAVIDKLN